MNDRRLKFSKATCDKVKAYAVKELAERLYRQSEKGNRRKKGDK